MRSYEKRIVLGIGVAVCIGLLLNFFLRVNQTYSFEDIQNLSFHPAYDDVKKVITTKKAEFKWDNSLHKSFYIYSKRIEIPENTRSARIDMTLAGSYNDYSTQMWSAPFDCTVYLIGYDQEGNQVAVDKETVVFNSKSNRGRFHSYKVDCRNGVERVGILIRIGCIDPQYTQGMLEISNVHFEFN